MKLQALAAILLAWFSLQACSTRTNDKVLPRIIVLTDINNVGGDPAYAFKNLDYPHPDSLRNLVARNEKEAINRIIHEAAREDGRPLYILVWGGRFIRPFPDTRPNYWIDDAGIDEWNYEDPCETWDKDQQVYLNRLQCLLDSRESMYASYREKCIDCIIKPTEHQPFFLP